MPDGGLPPLDLNLHPKQFQALSTVATELLYGGAAGGGKSHLERVAAIMWCCEIPGLQVYIFRRVEDDLIKNHMEGPKGFRNLLAVWVNAGLVKIIETEIRFWNGSKIFLCHCKDEKHRYKYHGAEIHVLIIDELTTFTEIIYRYLRFRVRMVGIELPEHYRKGGRNRSGEINTHNLFPRILCGSNPGNVGHNWVKRTFLEVDDPMLPKLTADIEGGMWRQYIPALLEDNPSMDEDDPTYRQRMRGLGDPALVRAMELGDWNIIAGGFFPEFTLQHHVLKAQTLPMSVFGRRFIGVDWGSARPFSVGWYGICDETWRAEGTLGNILTVPRGALVRYREWYGAKPNEDNKGVKMPVERWAAGLLQRTPEPMESIAYTTVDTSMFDEDGGPSLAERAMGVRVDGKRLILRPSDKRRLPGWDQMHARFIGDGEYDPATNKMIVGTPMLFLMDNQPAAIRVIQSVQHDELKVEDLDTDMEDHPVDEIRYACMSRPLPTHKKSAEKRKPKGPKPFTYDWIIQQGQPQKRSTYNME